MNRFLVIFLIFALISGLAIAGCAPKPAAPTPAKTLKVGISADFSSVAAGWGIPIARSIELAAEQINAEGGVKIGRDTYLIETIRADNTFTSEGGKTSAERLIYRDKVHFILGGVSTHDTLGVQMVTTPAQVINISTCWEKKAIKEEGKPTTPYAFKSLPTPRETTRGIFDYIKKTYPEVKRFAIVAPNLMSSLFSAQLQETYARHIGWEIVFKEHFEYGTRDFYPVLTKALAAKPDLIEISDAGISDMGLLVKQAREMGYKGPITNDTPVLGPDVFSIAGIEAFEGFIAHEFTTFGPNGTPEYIAFAESFEKKHGTWTTWILSQAGALQCVVQAMQDVGNVDDTDAIVEALETSTFKVYGYNLSFGGAGYYGKARMLGQPIMVVEVEGGKIEPKDVISTELQLGPWPTD